VADSGSLDPKKTHMILRPIQALSDDLDVDGRHLEAGKFIVGSHFVHNCPHIPESAMYHKIVQAAYDRICKSACWLSSEIGSKSGKPQVQRKRTSDGGVGKMFHYQLATEVPCD